MDALMVDKGDPWHPEPATIERCHRMCAEVSRVLVPGGVFAQLSFEQVHFRRKFLLGEHAASANANANANAAADDGSGRSSPGHAGQSAEEKDVGGGPYGWNMEVHDVQREGGCFGHLLYILRKRRGEPGDGVVEKGE